MSNIFIEQYKYSLQKLFDNQKSGNDEIRRNNARFLPEIAAERNLKEVDKQQAAFIQCQQEIHSIFDTVRTCCAKASHLYAGQMTEDRNLLDSHISIPILEIRARIEEYSKKGNFTMLYILKDWIGRQPQTLELANVAAEIVMPQDMLEVYQRYGNEALRIAAKIRVNAPIMQSPLEMTLFNDEGYHAADFALIGTGGLLNDYKSLQVPNVILHQFDEIVLTDTALESVMM